MDDHELSATIRNSEELDVEDYYIRHRHCKVEPVDLPSRCNHPLALLRTCRQVHNEAALLPFQTNTFSFLTSTGMNVFLKTLMAVQRRAIVSMVFGSIFLHSARKQVKELVGLKELILFAELPEYLWILPADASSAREQLMTAVSVFEPLSLTSATVCIYHNTTFAVDAKADLAKIKALSEEAEAKLLEPPNNAVTEVEPEEEVEGQGYEGKQ